MSWPFSNSHPPHPPPPHPAASFPFGEFGAFQPGYGVDHTTPGGFGPNMAAGFFAGPEAWGGHGRWRGRWGRRGGGHRFNPWGDHHGRWHHGRHPCCCSGNDEPESGADDNDDAAPRTTTAADRDSEKEDSPATAANDDGAEHPDPPEEVPTPGGHQRGCRRGGRGRCRGAAAGGRGRGHHHGHGHHHHGAPPAYEEAHGAGPFDLRGLMQAVTSHPFAQQIREQVERARSAAVGARATGDDDDDDDELDGETFAPPVDIFDGADAWTVHVALPGAKKEDLGVSWDATTATLSVTGVVYRPGDEAFLSGLVTGERKVGLFRRKVKLPPAGGEEKDKVDGEGIVARMENGVLVVAVPKVEREWTEVRKVDIE